MIYSITRKSYYLATLFIEMRLTKEIDLNFKTYTKIKQTLKKEILTFALHTFRQFSTIITTNQMYTKNLLSSIVIYFYYSFVLSQIFFREIICCNLKLKIQKHNKETQIWNNCNRNKGLGKVYYSYDRVLQQEWQMVYFIL